MRRRRRVRTRRIAIVGLRKLRHAHRPLHRNLLLDHRSLRGRGGVRLGQLVERRLQHLPDADLQQLVRVPRRLHRLHLYGLHRVRLELHHGLPRDRAPVGARLLTQRIQHPVDVRAQLRLVLRGVQLQLPDGVLRDRSTFRPGLLDHRVLDPGHVRDHHRQHDRGVRLELPGRICVGGEPLGARVLDHRILDADDLLADLRESTLVTPPRGPGPLLLRRGGRADMS